MSADKKSSIAKKIIWLAIIAILLVIGIFGKQKFDEVQTRKRYDAFLDEAKTFIEKREFSRASDSIKFANDVLPGLPEAETMQSSLDTAIEVDLLEKRLLVNLQKKEWASVEKDLESLKKLSPGNVKIVEGKTAMERGKRLQQIELLEAKLAMAESEGRLYEVLANVEKLYALEPTHEKAEEWKRKQESTKSEISKREARAKVVFEQAKTLDLGSYDEQLIYLAEQATQLSNNADYKAFYDKVQAYPRTIRFPQEFLTLQKAIDVAREHDVIQLSPGEYLAPIVINKQVTLKGSAEKPVILHRPAKEGAVVFVTAQGTLTAKNLMFKHSESSADLATYSAVSVEGKATFESCLFYESAGHGLHVVNGGDAVVLSCRAESNRWDGFSIEGKGSKATIKTSITAKNKHHGVDAWKGGKVELVDSISELNFKSGLVALTGGQITTSGSTSRKNIHSGLYVAKQGNVSLRGCELSDNKLGGAYGDQSKSVDIAGCKVERNKVAGIILTKGTTWTGLDTVMYIDNQGKDLWDSAVFKPKTSQ